MMYMSAIQAMKRAALVVAADADWVEAYAAACEYEDDMNEEYARYEYDRYLEDYAEWVETTLA